MSEDIAAWVRRLRRRPPARALAWVEQVTGGTVTRVRPLPGGLGNGMHVVDVATGGGATSLVLRRYLPFDESAQDGPGSAGSADEHDYRSAGREAAVLAGLAEHGVPAPRLVAADPDGTSCDVPAVLTTRVDGWRRLPAQAAPAWLDSLAAALYAVHTSPTAAYGPLPDLVAKIGERLAGPPPPSYADRPADLPLRDLVAEAFTVVVAADHRRLLVHDDYWGGNTLRRGHRVVAVVDWASVGLGLPGMDVGYCAMDLALAYGEEAAARFVVGYERLAGPVEHLALWELLGALRPADPAEWLSGWRELGLSWLTADLVRERLAGVKARAAARVDLASS